MRRASLFFLVPALGFISIVCSGLNSSRVTHATTVVSPAQTEASSAGDFEVKSFGAKGDGKTLDTPAINRAIDAAATAGGGTVHFSAGTYRCFSIHLKSNVALYLDQGATILAADPADKDGQYDSSEPNQWDQDQDFG